ncbi:MAG TPA: DUF5658 family protein [Planctomycetota bacterium]|nr:DUF5658 family protein [Planctomycetota bacterium]
MTASDGQEQEEERRVPRDRRRRPTPWMSRHWLTGRRRGARRTGDPAGLYVDRYDRRDWLLVGGILVACVLDLLLTLDYLRHGGQEWNPLMAHALQKGDAVFVLTKLGLTTGCMLFLLVRIHFRGVRRAVQMLLAAYLLLMVWHGVVRLGLPEDPAPVAAARAGAAAGAHDAESPR